MRLWGGADDNFGDYGVFAGGSSHGFSSMNFFKLRRLSFQ